jgi:hypothetical protein
MVALSGERNLLMFKVSGIAFLARLLHRSDISFTICAATFLYNRFTVVSRHASASRTGRATFFYARRIILAPSFYTLLSALASLTVIKPQAEGLYATTFVATSCQDQQSDVSRDLQSALLLCCSAALYALWIQSRLHTHESPWYIG